MSGEIISIHVGHCGNKIGSSFWNTISRDHGIDQFCSFNGKDFDFQIENIGVYFKESKNLSFFPRAVFADLDNESTETIRNSPLFSKSSIISMESTKRNNWASVFYMEDHDFIESIMESIREEAEACESISGFHLFHSLGGGTGSGLASMIMNELRDEYPDQITSTFSVLPSQKVDDYFLEPYNSIFNLKYLIQSADEVFYFDNEELYNLCFHKFRLYDLSFHNLNYPILCRISSITSSLRFPDQLNSDLKRIYANIIPTPNLKFVNSNFVPHVSQGSCFFSPNAKCLISPLFDKKEFIRLCGYVNFNGRFQPDEVKETMDIINSNENTDLKFSVCGNRIDFTKTATLVENSTKIIKILERQKNDFLKFYKKRNNVQYFINEGLDSVDFEDSNMKLTNLIQDYEDLNQINDDDENEEDYYI